MESNELELLAESEAFYPPAMTADARGGISAWQEEFSLPGPCKRPAIKDFLVKSPRKYFSMVKSNTRSKPVECKLKPGIIYLPKSHISHKSIENIPEYLKHIQISHQKTRFLEYKLMHVRHFKPIGDSIKKSIRISSITPERRPLISVPIRKLISRSTEGRKQLNF